MKNIDYRKLLFITGAIFISAYVGWKGQPLIHDNNDAASMIVDVFSILAGFLMAVLTLLIEPKPTTKIWREAEATKFNFINRIVRYKWLFMLYLITLGLIFAARLISKSKGHDQLLSITESLYLGSACLAFIISLTLPNQLMQLQATRYNEMIEAKKEEQ